MPDPCRPDHRAAGTWTKLKDPAGYVAVFAVCLGILAWLLGPHRHDLATVFYGDCDWLFTAFQVQSMLESGWHHHHPRVGMPFGSNLLDFPMADGLHFGLMKGCATLFGFNAFELLNLHLLLSFPLTALTAYFTLRRLGCGRMTGLVGAELYAFLFYHAARMQHPFLAAYYLVPPTVLVLLRLLNGPGLVFVQADGSQRTVFERSWRTALSIGLAVLVGAAGIYYAFFACFFLALVAATAAWGQRRFHAARGAVALAAIIMATGALQVLPSMLHAWREGSNERARHSQSIAAELYGLKMTSLLMPQPQHPLEAFRKTRGHGAGRALDESVSAALGTVGTIGFVLLLVRFFVGRPLCGRPEETSGLALLNVAGLLLAIVGGLGTIVAFLIPEIRAYNRMSIYLAFFAIAAFCLFAQDRLGALATRRWGRTGAYALLLAVLALGICDQVHPHMFRGGEAMRTARGSDAAFVAAIESRLPAGAMVYQLPYHPFPETAPPGTMRDYDHLRGPLFSRTLRWSYGASKSRQSDRWQARLADVGQAAGLPEPMLRTLVLAGFEGLYIDRHGYDDGGAAIERELTALLGSGPMRSANQRLLFYDLRPHAERLRQRTSPGEWETARRAAQRAPLSVHFSGGAGFLKREQPSDGTWKWAGRPSTKLQLVNDTGSPRRVRVSMKLAAAPGDQGTVRVRSPFWEEEIAVTDKLSAAVGFETDLAPGRHVVTLRTDLAGRPGPEGSTIYFRIAHFNIEDVEPLSSIDSP